MSRDNEEQDQQHSEGQDQQQGAGQDQQQGAADSAASGHQASVNQARDEPVPASHHDDRRTEAVERNEEFSQGRAEARPSRGGGSGPHPG